MEFKGTASARPFKDHRSFSADFPEESRDDYVARLVATFHEVFAQLQIDVGSDRSTGTRLPGDHAPNSITGMASFIYESMSTSARNYHYVEHVFDLIRGDVCGEEEQEENICVLDAIAILAALFHDCVYANIDGGLSKLQKQKLQGAIHEVTVVTTTSSSSSTTADDGDKNAAPTTTAWTIAPLSTETARDKLLSMVLQVFGMAHGETLLPGKGGNEFLSAVIAVRELEAWVPFPDLVKIAVCIEATIPFRPANPVTGESALEILYQRLKGIVKDSSPVSLTEEECLEAVQRACLVANEDIGNFATSNHAMFMDKTWSLLPESNAALRQAYTIFEFHHAVFKMRGFFEFVKADLIFQQFRGTPSTALLERLTRRAAANIVVGGRYLAVKLISVTFLAAIAQLSGGDAPISLFMGELPGTENGSRRLEDVLELQSMQTVQENSTIDMKVYRLLAEGRLSETAFDVKQSPLSAYFYGIMGDERVQQVLEGAGPLYPMSNDLAWTFLKMLPFEAVGIVASLIAGKVSEREQAILNIVRTLEP
jgi:hypothetical protein